MAEIKAFASDASLALIDAADTFLSSPQQQRWCAGVAVYLFAAFLAGNAFSEMWNIYLRFMA
jgi:hypothetical protein